MPRRAISAIVGLMVSFSAFCVISSVIIGAGEYAPMPPVFGPLSPSKARLWSCAVPIGRTFSPSDSTKNEASSPSMNSSITTSAPAVPKAPPNMSSIAARASSSSMATTTPLPAARPSALITMGAPCSRTYALAASASLKWA